MTITAIAKELNTSTMTVYRRLRKAGIDLDQLRDENSGEVTAAGATIIASLFDTAETSPQDTEQPTGAAAASGAVMAAEVLQARVDGLQALVDTLTDERNQLREQVKQLTAALEREQTDRQHERLLLTGDAAEGAQPRRRWWPWARR